MKKSPEEEMAEALSGQFFWEQTTKYDDFSCGMTADIRRVQRSFVAKEPKLLKLPPPTKKDMERVKLRLEAQKGLPEEIRKIKAFILEYYALSEREFEGEAGTRKLYPARCHYIWSVLRYNPNISLAGFGKAIGKHHSTILHNRDLFEKSKHLFEENIAAIDKAMGYC